MSSAEIHILSTRPLPETLIDEAARHGILIETQAFILTEPVNDEDMRQRVRALGQQRLAAIFTSMNAVEAVREWTGRADWDIFCIGLATRRLAEAYFGPGSIAGTAESAKALAEVIIRENPGREVHFFCGNQRRPELPGVLKQAGLIIHELVVYHTISNPVRTERSYDGIAFFSPSAVDSYFSVNTVSAGATLFAIGWTTAEAIRVYSANPLIVSGQPDKEKLIHEMIDHFQTKK
jgi:uroporphyrinogen-III synthase